MIIFRPQFSSKKANGMFPGCHVMGYAIMPGKVQGVRQMFSAEEDQRLKELVEKLGTNNWKLVARAMPNRSTRQCRERYKNYLSPTLTTTPWTKEEDDLLREKYAKYGPKWAQLALFFNGRSDVNIKNHWTSLSGRDLIEQRQAKIDLPQQAHDAPVPPPPVVHPVVVGSTITYPQSVPALPSIVPVPNEREPIETHSNSEEKKEADVADVVSAITTIKPVTLQDFSDPLPPLIVKDQPKAKNDNPIGNLAQLLWGTQERSGLLRVEEVTLKNDNAGLQNTFPGYGGHIW